MRIINWLMYWRERLFLCFRPEIEIQDGMVITRSVRIKPGFYTLSSGIIVRGTHILIRGYGAILHLKSGSRANMRLEAENSWIEGLYLSQERK